MMSMVLLQISPPLLVHESQSIAHLSARTWQTPIITKAPVGLVISGVWFFLSLFLNRHCIGDNAGRKRVCVVLC